MLVLHFICPLPGASAAEYRSGSLRCALRARPAAFAGSRFRPRFCVVSAGGFFHLRSIHAGCVSQRQRPQTANRPEGIALPLRRLLWESGSFSLCHTHYRKFSFPPRLRRDITGDNGLRERYRRERLFARGIAGNEYLRELSPGTKGCGRYRRERVFAGDIAGSEYLREISPGTLVCGRYRREHWFAGGIAGNNNF